MYQRRFRFLMFAWALAGLGPLLGQNAPATSASTSAGLGDLLVAPTRVVFDGRKRAAELNLSNIGSGSATYRITLVRMEMDEAGSFKEVPFEPVAAGQQPLTSLIRFSPREVTLGAQESQTIRLQVRKPAELPAGEYRLHLMFRAVPTEAAEPAPAETRAKGIGVKLTPVFGLAIPIIVRHGEITAKVAITGLALDPEARQIRFQLDRTGQASVYGDLEATLIGPGGKPERLCQANGVAVYTPNACRKVVLPVAAGAATGGFKGRRLRLSYSVPDVDGGGLLAEAVLDLP